MAHLHLNTDTLASSWVQYDWRVSPFASGFEALQALDEHHNSFSGSGCTRERALVRSIGETAEAAALREANLTTSFIAECDGIACGSSPDEATRAAYWEMIERNAVTKWWAGHSDVVKMDMGYRAALGVEHWLAQMRGNTAIPRHVDVYWQSPVAGFWLVVAISTNVDQGATAIGYGLGSCIKQTANKALRELFLMEFGLLERDAIQTSHVARAEHLRHRLPHETGGRASAESEPPSTDLVSNWLGCEFHQQLLTANTSELSVCLSQPGHRSTYVGAVSPFM